MSRKSFNRTRNRRPYNRVSPRDETPRSYDSEPEENAGVGTKMKKLFKGIKEAVSIKDDFTVADDNTPAGEAMSGDFVPESEGKQVIFEAGIKIEEDFENNSEKNFNREHEDSGERNDEAPFPAERETKGNMFGKMLGKVFKRNAQPAPENVISDAEGEPTETAEEEPLAGFYQDPEPAEILSVDDKQNNSGSSEPAPEKPVPAPREEDYRKDSDQAVAAAETNWMNRVFYRKDKSLAEILEIKKLEKKFLDDQVKNRRQEEARLLRKIRRSKRERKATLDFLAKARRDLNETLVAMKTGEANVKTLEKQTTFLQKEAEKESLRREKLGGETQNSQNKLEQLRNDISETEEKLQQITSAHKLRRQENDALNDLMDKTQRRLNELTATVEDQDRRRMENENILQETNSQAVLAEQMKQDKLKQGVQATEAVAEIQKKLEEKQHQVSVMESVAAELKRDMSDKQSLLNSYKDEIDSLAQNVERDRAQSEQVNLELKELENLKVQLNQQVYQTRAEVEKIEENKKNSELQLDGISVELTNSNSLLVERNRQVSALDSGIAELQQTIEKKQEAIIQLQQKLEALRQNGFSMAQKIEELQKQKVEALDILESTRVQITAAENLMSTRQAALKELEAQQDSLQNANDKLSEQIKNKEQEHLHLSESISMIMSSQEELEKKLNETRDEYQSVSEELNKINTDIDSKKRHYDNLFEEETALERTVEHRKIELADWDRKIADIQEKFDHLEREVAANTDTQEKLLKDIDQYREELSDLTSQKENTGKTLKTLLKKQSGLEKWIEDALEFRDQQATFIKDELAKSKELKSQVDELTQKLERNRSELEETDSENQRLMQERARSVQTAESELAELSRQLGEAKDRINQDQIEIEKMLNQEDELKSKISELQDNKEKYETETEEKKLLKEKVEAELKTTQEEFEKQSQQQNSRLETISQETESGQQKLDSINERLKIAETEVVDRETRQHELDKTLADSKTKLQEINAQIEMEMAGVSAKKESLQQDAERINSELASAQAKLNDIQASITLKANDETALLKRFQMLSQEVTEMETMKKESRELYRKIEEQKRILEDLELQRDKKSGLFT